jgi:hypothetical protein
MEPATPARAISSRHNHQLGNRQEAVQKGRPPPAPTRWLCQLLVVPLCPCHGHACSQSASVRLAEARAGGDSGAAGAAGDVPVRVTPLSSVAAVVRRRSSLKPVALELFFGAPDSSDGGRPASQQATSVFFSFRSAPLACLRMPCTCCESQPADKSTRQHTQVRLFAALFSRERTTRSAWQHRLRFYYHVVMCAAPLQPLCLLSAA